MTSPEKKSVYESTLNNIKALRLQHKWNQKDMSERLGISVPAYSKIESGVTDINLSRLEQIAYVFGVTLPKLFSIEDDEINSEAIAKLNMMRIKLAGCDSEITSLQRKVINLYEELQAKKAPGRHKLQ